MTSGPFDVCQVNLNDGVNRIDLGGLVVPAMDGIDVQVQIDEESGKVASISLAAGDAVVQVQPFAAPKSASLWDDIRVQIRDSITANGGLVEEVQGNFGQELLAQVNPTDGSSGLQPARFVGIDGPRWFLRAIFLGSAARSGTASERLELGVRSLIINRGNEAMPVGTPLLMSLPTTDDSADA